MNFDHAKELKLFYTSISFYTFASSIVQIFIPIYLFGKGFSISSILLFYALMQLGRLAALPAAAYLSSNFGAKKVIGVSFIFQIIYFLFLRHIEVNNLSWYFLASALIFGAMWAFLWLPYLVHVSKISPNENRGKIVGKINIYSALTSALGPLLGGAVIASYGFSYAFALAILITIPAIILLLRTPEASKIRKINYSLINVRKIFPDFMANGFFNFQNFLDSIVWTIFIFIIIPQYKTIGLIQTAALLVSVLSYYLIGILTDKFNRAKLLAFGSFLTAIAGILRLLANSFLGILLLNTVFTSVYILERIPWNVKVQEHMDQDARTEYMAIFEIGGTIITLIGLLILAILFSSMPLKESLVLGLIIASVSGLFVNFVRK